MLKKASVSQGHFCSFLSYPYVLLFISIGSILLSGILKIFGFSAAQFSVALARSIS